MKPAIAVVAAALSRLCLARSIENACGRPRGQRGSQGEKKKPMIRRVMEAIINHCQWMTPGRVALVAVASLLALIAPVRPGGATVGTITKADLSGLWAATITGDTRRGITT